MFKLYYIIAYKGIYNCSNHFCFNNIYNFFSELSKSDDEELIHSAIQSILRIKDVLSPELIYEVSTNIGKMALESNN